MAASCSNTEYRKTKSGLLYKIFRSNNKDSVAKTGNYIKLNFVQKVNDSVIVTSYGKMPVYINIQPIPAGQEYNPTEILPLLRKGDSAITVMLADTLIKRGLMQPGNPFKKNDRIVLSLRVLEVFRNDSLYQADMQKEQEKDMPRQMKEREKEMTDRKKQRMDERDKEFAAAEKSGDVARGLKAMEAYLAAKKITATKTGRGTYAVITEQGTGPAAAADKYVKVKYTGRRLVTDSVFQSNVYAFQLGVAEVVAGWDEGLQLLKQGGKATLYIPGFMAYGKNPPPNSPFKENDPLIFDVELLEVSDQPIAQQQ